MFKFLKSKVSWEILALILLFGQPVSYGDNKSIYLQKEALAKSLQELEALKKKSAHKRTQTIALLKTTEKKIGELYERQRQHNEEIKSTKVLLKKLNIRQKKLDAKNKEQALLLEKHLISAYELGRYPLIKMFLNQQTPQMIDRLVSYYSYINRARFLLIRDQQQTLANIKKTKIEKAQNLEKLAILQKTEAAEQQALAKEEIQQSELVKSLSQFISSQDEKISQVKKSFDALDKVLTKISQQRYPVPKAPFYKMLYQLEWPTPGLLNDLYGKPISGTNLRYSGVKILAEEKQTVISVYPGRVVFADWLRGFGLITIIDHGQGYMTLYANNHSLLKRQGDLVAMNEAIATVGHTGGQQDSGVYFEIRRNGRPVDPLRWLRAET